MKSSLCKTNSQDFRTKIIVDPQSGDKTPLIFKKSKHSTFHIVAWIPRLIFCALFLQEIIAETTARLEETTAQRDKTQRALDCTRTVLHKTEGDRAEQVNIIATSQWIFCHFAAHFC